MAAPNLSRRQYSSRSKVHALGGLPRYAQPAGGATRLRLAPCAFARAAIVRTHLLRGTDACGAPDRLRQRAAGDEDKPEVLTHTKRAGICRCRENIPLSMQRQEHIVQKVVQFSVPVRLMHPCRTQFPRAVAQVDETRECDGLPTEECDNRDTVLKTPPHVLFRYREQMWLFLERFGDGAHRIFWYVLYPRSELHIGLPSMSLSAQYAPRVVGQNFIVFLANILQIVIDIT